MKKLFALLMCVAVLIATFSSCDASDVFDEIVDTAPHTDSEDTPKPAEKIPSGLVFTSFGDGTCALTGIYLNSDEAKVLTIPTTSPSGDKVVEVDLDFGFMVPSHILKDTLENEVLGKMDTLSQFEQMQLQNFFRLYSLDDHRFQNAQNSQNSEAIEVIKNDWLKRYPIIEKEAIYVFTGATIREYVAISAILDKIGFDYQARMDAVREVRELARQLDATNEYVKRFLEYAKYPFSFGELEEIIVPEGVLSVHISGATNVKKISLPNGVETIEKSAFSYCSSLEQINIPDTVKTIVGSAFFGCEALKNVVIPSSVSEIGKSAFGGCVSLETLNIPDGVTKILENSFVDCKALRSVTIPVTVTEIAENAFEGSGIRELIYGGTQAEWNENFADLSDALADITVKCTDGAIAKG